MATYTATRAASGVPVAGHGFAGVRKVAYGSTTLSTAPVAADVHEMVRLPKGAIILSGRIMGTPAETITTVGSGTFDFDIGTPVSSDCFGNLGILGFNHVASSAVGKGTGYMINYGGLLFSGPVVCSAETIIQLTIVNTATGYTSAASAAAPVLWTEVTYLLP